MENLPEQITVAGKVCKPIFGMARGEAKRYAKDHQLRYKTVKVMPRSLRGKLDLHGIPYQPTVWIFVEVTADSPHEPHQRADQGEQQ